MSQPRIWIELLGRFSVRVGDREVPPSAFDGRLVRTLVRILLTRRGELVHKDVLIDALWGDRPPADPVRNLEILVVRARRALTDASLIETGSRGYLFARTTECQLDTERFVEFSEAGHRDLEAGRPAPALRAFREALDLWGGEPLPEDTYAEWAQATRRELGRRYVDTLEGAAAAALGASDPAEAVVQAERAVAREPLREASHLLLAQALAASGDAAGALEVLASYRARLADELGLDPSPAFDELHGRVLRGELLPAPKPVAVPAVAAHLGVEELPFVGREAEIASVLGTDGESASVLLVAGPSGAGKSRLLAEAFARSPAPVLVCRAFLAERREAWSLGRSLVREALGRDVDAVDALGDQAARALAQVVPEIEDIRDVPRLTIDPESRRALVIEGAVRIVEASGAALVLADDIQWADTTSLDLLGLIDERTSLRLTAAYRPEEVAPDSPVGVRLEMFRRHGARELTLGRLHPEEVGRLVADRELAGIITEESDGTPFAIAEVLRTLARDGSIARADDGRWVARGHPSTLRARKTARAGQRSAIEARAARLPPSARAELERLALLGREAPARLLARSTGDSQPSTLAALDVLARAELAKLGEGGWSTAHDLVAETIATTLPAHRRGRRHAELAEGLRAEGAYPGELAHHLAGSGDRLGGARAYADAAFGELSRFANEEAERLAAGGLDLNPDDETLVALLRARGEARARRGDLAGGEQDLRNVLERTPAGPMWSRTMASLAWLVAGHRDYIEGLQLAEAATAAAAGDQAARANALAVAGRIDMNLGDLDRCRACSDEALAIYESLGDPDGIAQVVDIQAIATFEQGELGEAVVLFERAATLFTNRGALFRAVMPLGTRSRALTLMGRHEVALVDSDRALALARMLGYPEGECYALLQRAFPFIGLGRIEEAEEAADSAIAIADALGHREWLSAATAARATARRSVGSLAEAEADFRAALELGEAMPIHATIAASGLAEVLVAEGRAAEARPFAERAVVASERNRGARHGALLARAEVAAALSDPDARRLAADALVEAEDVGHLSTVPRLRELVRGAATATGAARRSG